MRAFPIVALAGFVGVLLPACAGTGGKRNQEMSQETKPPERRYLLERVGDAAVVQVYADGFAKLPLQEKILIWHLSEAVRAGRDIYLDQRCRFGLELRDLIEEVLTHAEGVAPDTLAAVRHYAKLFWLNNGPYANLTARKFTMGTSPEEFARAVHAAEAAGATLPRRQGETTDQMLARLRPILFDPDFEPIVTNKNPGEDQDILTGSAVNFYQGGLSLEDLQHAAARGFRETAPLNSTLVKRPDGTVEERIWRCGSPEKGIPPGLYAREIAAICGHLREAIPHAPPKTAEALRRLIAWYEEGTTESFREYCIAWVAADDSPVDTINGFIEVYTDPRGQKGSWEGLVFVRNPDKTERIRKIASQAQWFEDHMPWDPAYRKPEVKGILANAIDVVIEAGDSGPITPIGINLPNPQDIREQYGSKSVQLANVVHAYDKSRPKGYRQEFCLTDEEFQRAETWATITSELTTDMHEVIGHASGRARPDLEGDPSDHIREYYSALEEARADLVALWFLGDPKLEAMGILDDVAEASRAEYEAYTRNALVQLRRVPKGDQIEEDHMRNRQMVVRWLMDHTDAIETVRRDGKTYYVVRDAEAWRRGAGQLLARVQEIKSNGDYEAAKDLFDRYGIHFDPALRDEIVARVRALDLPSYSGFVMPRLTAVRGADGTVADVRISYPMDLETQMLEWSGRRPAPAATGAPAAGAGMPAAPASRTR